MKLRRLLSAVTALLLVCSLPVSVLAAEYDLAKGSITVTAKADGQYVTQADNGIVDQKEESDTVIKQTDGNETSTTNTITIKAEENATANVTIQDVNIVISDPSGSPQDHSGQAAVTIDVADGAEANVTLDGVNINTKNTGGESANPETGDTEFLPGEAAVQITDNGDVTLELDGENTVQGGYYRAGVEKNTTAATETEAANGTGNLTITDENETAGSLNATGGSLGAGIGGGYGKAGNNITITGSAEVDATGGDFGSGIGGGISGSGSNITITGSAEVTATSSRGGAGIGGGVRGSGSNITITGNADVTAQGGAGGSGIGGGDSGSGSNITITGSVEVTAQGGAGGSGIGGGSSGTGNNFTVSGDAQVKSQGGNATGIWGAGAAIGDGGAQYQNGQEVTPNTDELTPNGKIEYYAPDADMETDDPYKTVIGTYVPPQPARPLYRVIDQDGKTLDCKAERKDGVLTIEVDADCASLTGTFGGMKALKARGVDTIVFVTKGATSTFAVEDLLAQGASGDTYSLTHDGEKVTFTLGNGTDIGKILK